MNEFQEFIEKSQIVHVLYVRDDPDWKALINKIKTRPGVYSEECKSCTLRVGMSESGLGGRLQHHMDEGYGTSDARRAEFPHYHEFYRQYLGRRLSIRWFECPLEDVRRFERAVRRETPGGIVWERFMRERKRSGKMNFTELEKCLQQCS